MSDEMGEKLNNIYHQYQEEKETKPEAAYERYTDRLFAYWQEHNQGYRVPGTCSGTSNTIQTEK